MYTTSRRLHSAMRVHAADMHDRSTRIHVSNSTKSMFSSLASSASEFALPQLANRPANRPAPQQPQHSSHGIICI